MTTIQRPAPAAVRTLYSAPAGAPASPADRPSRLLRLLDLTAPALASVAMVFGAPIGRYSLAALRHRDLDARRSR